MRDWNESVQYRTHMVRKSQYRYLLKILKSGLNRVNIEQVMAIQKFKSYYEIRGIDMIAGLQVSM